MRQGGLILAAGRVRPKKKKKRKKNKKKSAPPKTHHKIHGSPATATTSRRRATKHVPRVIPYSPVSINPGFVEIGPVQLSHSVKTTNVTHTRTDRQTGRQADRQTSRQTDRQTDRQINQVMAPCTHPGMKRLFLPKGKYGLGRFAPSALPHYEEAFSPTGKKGPH